MIKRRVLFCVLLWLAIVGYYIWSNDIISFYLMVMYVAVVLLAVLMNFVAAKRMVVNIVTKIGKEDTDGSLNIHIKNKSILPVFHIRTNVKLVNNLTKQELPFERRSLLLPREARNVEIGVESLCCGKIETDVVNVACYDFLGLTRVSVQASNKGHYYHFPERKDIYLDEALHQNRNNSNFQQYLHRKGNDPTEVLDIRDYQRGDSVKLIHWKLSGKLGKKVVRELDMPSNQEVLLVFGLQEEAQGDNVHDLVEYMLSLSQSLLEEDLHHDALLLNEQGGLRRMCSIEGGDSYDYFERQVLSGELGLDAEMVNQYMMEKDLERKYCYVVYVTDEMPEQPLDDVIYFVVADMKE